MANPPYSVPMFRVPNFSGGRSSVYTVPPNRRAVLKSITTVWGVAALDFGIDAWLEDDAGCKIYRINIPVSDTGALGGGMDLQFGSWVFLDGETIWANVDAGTVDMQGSGYELVLPSP